MSPERWHQITDIFHAARQRDARQRETFLDDACRRDADLRREVNALLAGHDQAGSFGATAFAESSPLEPGRTLGAYQISALIGQGGMGVVYRAFDTILRRTVAIKVLSADFRDADLRRRFRHEAQTASALSHPHILTVYEFGELDGRDYLVTEFIDGWTLRAWARDRDRSWVEVIDLLAGIADGLSAAHVAGIVHRDVKPDNILVAKTGFAKLADFGVAKLCESPGDSLATGTGGPAQTRPGTIIGTIGYMSPEQVVGGPIDARSDIFSLGVVLYELLTGRRPFAGATHVDELHNILHAAAPPDPGAVPPGLCAIVKKALERHPQDRYQTMRELVIDLRRLVRQADAESIEPTRSWSSGLGRRGWLAAAMVALLVAAAVGAAILTPNRAVSATPARIRSIAVLPLQNLTRDAEQDFLSDGITEALISNLAQIHALDVTSRTSVMRFKATTRPLLQIAKELGVDGIVEGSVQRVQDRVRITVQLINGSTDKHLWAGEYERRLEDLLKLEADVARTVAQEIRAQVTLDEARRLVSDRTVNGQAQEAYLLGRYHAWRGTDVGYEQAIDYFERAIKLQPDFAAAYAGLSRAWLYRRSFGFTHEAGGRTAAQRALELDPNLAEAYAALGRILQEDWEWAGAEHAFKRALELNPDSLADCGCYANYLTALGHFPQAFVSIEHDVKVNPLSPFVHFEFGLVLWMARRYEDALPHFQRALELEPQNRTATLMLSWTFWKLGKFQDAVALLDRPELRDSAQMALYDVVLGRRDAAQRILRVLTAHDGGPNPQGIAQVYFALGDRDRGFEWLTKALDRHQSYVHMAKVNPAFDDTIRADPRFKELINRLKLPD